MRAGFSDLWGVAQGPVTTLAPHSRVIAGLGTLACCLMAPASTRSGMCLIAAAAVIWIACCAPPIRILRASAVAALVLFFPYLLLAPWVGPASASGWLERLAIPGAIAIHGAASMLVSIATIATLSQSDLRVALQRLPVPSLVSAITLQIVHQTAMLSLETKRIASAVAVRGAVGRGTAAWKVIVALPQVWLPRVLIRAERVADVMDLRGYCEADLPMTAEQPARLRDYVAAGMVAAAIGVAGYARFG